MLKITFNFSNAQNIVPKSEDKIIISSKIDLTRTRTVSIEGEVSEPNNYPFFDGMTLIDLILVSKGVTLKGDLKNIEMYIDDKLIKNFNAVIDTLEKEKSNNTLKGDLIKSVFLTSSMGVSYKLKLGKNI